MGVVMCYSTNTEADKKTEKIIHKILLVGTALKQTNRQTYTLTVTPPPFPHTHTHLPIRRNDRSSDEYGDVFMGCLVSTLWPKNAAITCAELSPPPLEHPDCCISKQLQSSAGN